MTGSSQKSPRKEDNIELVISLATELNMIDGFITLVAKIYIVGTKTLRE
jgi:hypothetical protein